MQFHLGPTAASLLFALGGSAAFAQVPAPRRPVPPQDLRAQASVFEQARSQVDAPWSVDLVVKFEDRYRARARDDGSLFSQSGLDLSPVSAIIAQEGGSFRALIQTGEDVLADLERRAQELSGRDQPDLAGMLIVVLPAADSQRLALFGEGVQARPEVEFASLHVQGAPPPGDIAPPTPNLVSLQIHRIHPPGLDAAYIQSIGATGGGVRLSDCEYGWNYAHEDLNDISLNPEPGQTIPSFVITNGWDEHGTAVIGVTNAVPNLYGCTGLVPDATVHTYPEWSNEQGPRRVTCIANAIGASAAGDVVLLEMQSGNLAPAETDPAVWTVVNTAISAGVVIVAAAGNGGHDLDSSAFSSYQAMGDSGAIIVGAGSADSNHDRLGFSCYGSRVNAQGWGGSVFTLGYGSYAEYGMDKNQRYIQNFTGTSSASPFVASACVAIQDAVKSAQGVPLSPSSLRSLLTQTGIPQGSATQSQPIGPFPDVEAAIHVALCKPGLAYCTAKISTHLCMPSMADNNSAPSISNPSSYVITTSSMEINKNGFTFFGTTGPSATPYQDGYMCVKSPHYRLATLNTGGGPFDCTGSLSYTLADLLAHGGGGLLIGVGTTVNCQTWSRDPGASFTSSWSNGFEFVACP